MKELTFKDQHLRTIVKERLDKEFAKCNYSKDGKLILVEKLSGGRVAVIVTKEGFKVVPLTKKRSFWPMALIMAFLIQVTAFGLSGVPKFLTMIAAFVLILIAISIVASFSSAYSKNRFFAERIEEYLDKELLNTAV